jgi:hypothetical protein
MGQLKETADDARPRWLVPLEIVYVTAVVGRLDDPLYDDLLQKVRKLHPSAALLSARDLWANPEGWRSTFRAVLFPVTHVYLIPWPDEVIGEGLAMEISYLTQIPGEAPRIMCAGPRLGMKRVHGLTFDLEKSPTHFARLVTTDLAQATSGGLRHKKKQPH